MLWAEPHRSRFVRDKRAQWLPRARHTQRPRRTPGPWVPASPARLVSCRSLAGLQVREVGLRKAAQLTPEPESSHTGLSPQPAVLCFWVFWVFGFGFFFDFRKRERDHRHPQEEVRRGERRRETLEPSRGGCGVWSQDPETDRLRSRPELKPGETRGAPAPVHSRCSAATLAASCSAWMKTANITPRGAEKLVTLVRVEAVKVSFEILSCLSFTTSRSGLRTQVGAVCGLSAAPLTVRLRSNLTQSKIIPIIPL